MSDFEHPNNKQAPTSEQETNIEPPQPSELPPYRQSDNLSKKTASKLPLWLLPVLAAVLIIGVLLGKYWDGSDKAATDESPASSRTSSDGATASATSTEQAVLSVETVSPSQDDIGNTLSADGTIDAKDTANVSAKVNGVAIERIVVEEGDRVKAGQVLAIFDTDAMEQQVLQAEADVAEAEATLANASADAARVLPLLDIDAISKQEADRYRTAKLQAQAALQASKARLSTQRLSVDNATVVAPVSGVISEKMAEVGMVAGGEPLFTIIKGGILEWRADIDPKLVGEVSVGTPVRVSLPDGDTVMGKVSRIAPTADNNRQITIYASLAANAKVRAGMYQTGEFLLGSASTQTVPNSAIVSNDGYDYVMLVTNVTTQDGQTMGRIKQQRVTLGERLGENVAVLEPLPSDSQIVKQGGSFLNDGDLVRIVDGVSQASTAAQAQP
ncbi:MULTISPECIES: efflux RND transporter periplasmic adaptor subunit [unclassified Psychrobacter]|uniref:efflux RND transporter periplasmic adaptor subunit n=1 Tax=unclassified Psychrobacter TaxID=196806 RepID=UPI000EC0D90A|nr:MULTISPECIES: efflux RND transporter periplasmic adaptor subunit [unclassified Psychrobacter]MBE8610484.1 efflux RND transporter periplasmic adaptor subunit [Pseudomonas lundensis]HCI77134.1 efflux RND transporter periplasmic adaptor subunit [Psychrobacter sp.]